MKSRFRLQVETGFELRLVLFSHGWIDLLPHGWDEDRAVFTTAFELDGVVLDLELHQTPSGLAATATSDRRISTLAAKTIRQVLVGMLRLDVELGEFWEMCKELPRLRWVHRRKAGRIFRAASTFEDLMKLLFTTNCSWAATRLMTARLVDALGKAAPSGRKAFPSARRCAAEDESFYREVVRAGYRSRSCVKLARAFADGEVDDDWFRGESAGSDVIRQRLLELPGFGPYAAGQAMRMLGHYEDLALDSWCRGRLAQIDGRKKPPSDRAIARRYARFGRYKGLALWMDLTAAWHGEP